MQRPCLRFQLVSALQCLTDCRHKVCEELGLQEDAVELSMGMSNDFEEAVSGLAAACAMQVAVVGKTEGARQLYNRLCFGLSVFFSNSGWDVACASIQWCPLLNLVYKNI